MGTRGSSEGRVRALYCLRCYAPIERGESASQRCERCGFVNVKLDQELFWTKEPRMVELEAFAALLIAGLLLLAGALGLGRLGRGLLRWRERHVLAAQLAGAARGSS